MEKQRKNSYARITKQVEEMRSLYSKIGQPLPADVILDLYRHLDTALEMQQELKDGSRAFKHRLPAWKNGFRH
jgi:hypothetical protein